LGALTSESGVEHSVEVESLSENQYSYGR
jgi:hypothetical protein